MLVEPKWLRAQLSAGWARRHGRRRRALGSPAGTRASDTRSGTSPARSAWTSTPISPPSVRRLRTAPAPSPDAFASSMSRLGIGDDSAVTAYDDVGGWVAARLWWMLRVLGRRAALLDLRRSTSGSTGRVARDRLVVGPDAGVVHAVAVAGRPGSGRRRSASNAEGRLGRRARRPRGERYRGEDEPIDPVPGHIPGSVSAERAANRDEQGRFLDAGVAPPIRGPRGSRRRKGHRVVRLRRDGGVRAVRDGARRTRPRAVVRRLVVGLGVGCRTARRDRTGARRTR